MKNTQTKLTKNAGTDFISMMHLLNFAWTLGNNYLATVKPQTLDLKNLKCEVGQTVAQIVRLAKKVNKLPELGVVAKELKESDALAFGTVFLHMLAMDENQRAILEDLIKELSLGNVITIANENAL